MKSMAARIVNIDMPVLTVVLIPMVKADMKNHGITPMTPQKA
jgi:hypothetical protein